MKDERQSSAASGCHLVDSSRAGISPLPTTPVDVFSGLWVNYKKCPQHSILMKTATRLDERGRLTIRRAYRKVLRDRVVQILTPHGVLLRPVPDTLPDRGRLPPALTEIGEEEAEREAAR